MDKISKVSMCLKHVQSPRGINIWLFSLSNDSDESVNFAEQISLSVMIENVGTETSDLITTTLINQTSNAIVLTSSITSSACLNPSSIVSMILKYSMYQISRFCCSSWR